MTKYMTANPKSQGRNSKELLRKNFSLKISHFLSSLLKFPPGNSDRKGNFSIGLSG
jgi:RNA:NAD 2'-phosphotransferase (TPT1/KptA family)